MSMTRRTATRAATIAILAAATSIGGGAVSANDDAGLAKAVEDLRVAIMKADKAKLTELAHDKMAYVHSSGRSETRDEYVAAYTSGKSTYKSLVLADHANSTVGDHGIVRHTFAAEIDRGGGKVDNIKIGVTQVWVKQGGAWKMLARQGYKL